MIRVEKLRYVGIASLGIRLSIWACLGALSICISWLVIGPAQLASMKSANADHTLQKSLLETTTVAHRALEQQITTLRANKSTDTDIPKIPATLNLNAISETLSRISRQYHLRLKRLLPVGSRQEEFYRSFDIQTELQGSYPNLARFAKSLKTASNYPFVIQEAFFGHKDESASLLAQTASTKNPPSLGIQLRMRGFCCLNDETSSESGADSTQSTPHNSVQAIRASPQTPSQQIVTDPFSVSAKTLAPAKTTELVPHVESDTPSQPSSQNAHRAITIVPIQYTRAQRIADLVNALFVDYSGAVAVDERTNSLLLNNSGKALQDTRDAILALDVPIQQVLVEAVIVIVRHDFAKRLGIRLNLGETDAEDSIVGNTLSGNRGLAARIGFSFLNNRGQLQIALDAMESGGHGQVISRPRLVTNNLQTAYIKAGTQIPFQESAPNGRTTIQFRDAVLRLDVTPVIMPNNKIRLDLTINQDAPGAAVDTDSGRIPSIDTTELRTQIILKPSETAALGGVFRFDAAQSKSKTPLLGDLPLLGYLFRHTNKSIVKSETMFFITPHLLDSK